MKRIAIGVPDFYGIFRLLNGMGFAINIIKDGVIWKPDFIRPQEQDPIGGLETS